MNKLRQKQEAIRRMMKLGLMETVILDFEKDEKLYYSLNTPIGGILYRVSNDERYEKLIRDFEDRTGGLVYHVTEENTSFGRCLSLLFVSKYEEDWQIEREWLEKEGDSKPVAVYVKNLTYPECSEFGTIEVREAAGGLVRVA